jgi:hypothetical protein
MKIDVNDEFTQDVFEYLDNLRESGITNMYGAGPFLQESFGFDRDTAQTFLGLWTETFADRHFQGE